MPLPVERKKSGEKRMSNVPAGNEKSSGSIQMKKKLARAAGNSRIGLL